MYNPGSQDLLHLMLEGTAFVKKQMYINLYICYGIFLSMMGWLPISFDDPGSTKPGIMHSQHISIPILKQYKNTSLGGHIVNKSHKCIALYIDCLPHSNDVEI